MELVGCKMSSRKLLKLNGTPESLPTAWGLIKNPQKLKEFSEIEIEKIEEITCSQEPLKDYLKSEELLLGKS